MKVAILCILVFLCGRFTYGNNVVSGTTILTGKVEYISGVLYCPKYNFNCLMSRGDNMKTQDYCNRADYDINMNFNTNNTGRLSFIVTTDAGCGKNPYTDHLPIVTELSRLDMDNSRYYMTRDYNTDYETGQYCWYFVYESADIGSTKYPNITLNYVVDLCCRQRTIGGEGCGITANEDIKVAPSIVVLFTFLFSIIQFI